MIRRPPRSTPLYSSAASDVYKRQYQAHSHWDWRNNTSSVGITGEGVTGREAWSRTQAGTAAAERPLFTTSRLEAAELALHHLDAQLVAGAADFGQWNVEVARDLESLGAGEALLVAGLRLEGLDETGDVACTQAGECSTAEGAGNPPGRLSAAAGPGAHRSPTSAPGLVSFAKMYTATEMNRKSRA